MINSLINLKRIKFRVIWYPLYDRRNSKLGRSRAESGKKTVARSCRKYLYKLLFYFHTIVRILTISLPRLIKTFLPLRVIDLQEIAI